jgi:tRNA (guanine10-N2)-dimethyltransferase
MYISILGRQPALGLAELERVFGGANITRLSSVCASIDTDQFDIQRLGGSLKAGRVVLQLKTDDWHSASQKIVQHYLREWSSFDGKITFGISAYDIDVSPQTVQKTGIILKQKLKKLGTSLRLIPNQDSALSTATSHHNKLGLSANKVELIVIKTDNNQIIIAESCGSQNITAYASRDQMRPKRDAFVGMLPPKLAQIMVNLSGAQPSDGRILDPFCGTGVILQEAALQGFDVYGTDLVDKMVSFSRDNLEWLSNSHHVTVNSKLTVGDAMTAHWDSPIGAVVAETYLGQPFSAPPSPSKLAEVTKNCNHIITEFLKNLSPQIQPGTPVCIAIPAWRGTDGQFTFLPLVATIARLGFKPHEFHSVSQNDLLYYREDQVVARQLLVLTKV